MVLVCEVFAVFIVFAPVVVKIIELTVPVHAPFPQWVDELRSAVVAVVVSEPAELSMIKLGGNPPPMEASTYILPTSYVAFTIVPVADPIVIYFASLAFAVNV